MRRVEMKKQYVLGALVFVIALVTVGFALLQSSLSINGTVSTKSNSWNIYFDNIVLNQDSVSKTLPTISNRTSLSFNVELEKPGDIYEFSVDAVNDGSIDAMINTITATNLTVEQAKLIDLSYTYDDGASISSKDYLKASTRETIKVSVKYKEDISSTDLSNSNISLPISIAIEYVQADETAKERKVVQQDINLYNLMKENADKTTVINFSEHSGMSGTNGIYTTTATDGNVPVYYYRGKVDNNVIFANYCWKIIRTTETGGVKIIYNGTPTSDGKCNKPNFTAGTETAQSGTTSMSSSATYYYGSSYTFDENAGYKLSGTIKSGVWSESFASGVKNYYTCMGKTQAETCITLYKITGYSSTTAATYSRIEATVNTDTQTGTSRFNSSYKDNAYVGYMYGATGATTYAATHTNTNDSTIKTYLEGTGANDGWFNTSGLKNYQDRLEDTVFCNDRSTVAGGNNNTLDSSTYGTLGYGQNFTGYGALARSSGYTTSPNPTYACKQANDKFTLKETQTNYNSNLNGNKKLDYPVGLITSDEAIFAGFNTHESNSNYHDTNNYLYTGQHYWIFSPVYYFSDGIANVGYVNSSGFVGSYFVDYTFGVRPVVSLKSGTMVTGTGTPEKPYVVQ